MSTGIVEMINPIYSQANTLCQVAYDRCEHAWSYIGKANLISRFLLNAMVRTPHMMARFSKDFPCRISRITTQMKLLSIVGVPFSLVDLKSTIKKIYESIQKNHVTEVILGTISVTILVADMFDSITTFVNAVLALTSIPKEIFSSAGLPIGFLMSGLGAVSRIIKIGRNLSLYATHLNEEEQRHLRVKITVDALGLLANVVTAQALILFSVGMSGPLPFLLLSAAFGTRLFSVIYQDCQQ